MNSRMIRAIAALAAVASVSTAGVASAAMSHTITAGPATHVQPTYRTMVSVFPTGDGPGDEEVCGRFEVNIDQQYTNLSHAIDNGDEDRALGDLEAIGNLKDMAMDAGCAVID
jgi:hypothetical protein